MFKKPDKSKEKAKLAEQLRVHATGNGSLYDQANVLRLRVNDAEGEFLTKVQMRRRQTKVMRAGWPDFMLVEDGRIYAVEVKSKYHRVSAVQAAIFETLEKKGIKVSVWTPGKPDRLLPWHLWNREMDIYAREKKQRALEAKWVSR